MNEQAGSGRGKVVIVILLLMIGGAVAAIGAMHMNRNKRKHAQGELNGAQLYQNYCNRCHQPDGKGNSSYPSLFENELSAEEFVQHVKTGKGTMPAFTDLFPEDYQLLYEHLQQLKKP